MCACVCMYVSACKCAYTFACVCACMRACESEGAGETVKGGKLIRAVVFDVSVSCSPPLICRRSAVYTL